MHKDKALVLFSGGQDSTVCLAWALERFAKVETIGFDYGQRHCREIKAAKRLARKSGSTYQIIRINLPWKGSSLLDRNKKISRARNNIIPATYVPARNIIFLSFALSFAEAIAAKAIFIGAHSQDYSGYPDCRPEFYQAFRKVSFSGTKAGLQNKGIEIITPLIYKSKAQIIRMGSRLGVPFELTWSCYKGGKEPCGKCDSCYYRIKGFREAGIAYR